MIYTPPPPPTIYTLTQVMDSGRDTSEVIAQETSAAILRCVVQADLDRTATRGYARELLRYLDLAEYAAQTDPSDRPYRIRIRNGWESMDEYRLTITRPAARKDA